MRPSLPLPSVAFLLFAAALISSGCQTRHPGEAHVPTGANSRHAAAVKFFNAYKAHDRRAAKEVAADEAIDALVFDASAGTNPTLRLVDDEHISYEGGSIELRLARTGEGRWFVQSVSSTAD